MTTQLTMFGEREGGSFSAIVSAQNADEVPTDQLDVSKWGRQLRAVHDAMKHGRWMTLGEIAFHAKCPEASASARIRDLKKKGIDHEMRRVKDGLTEYRIVRNEP